MTERKKGGSQLGIGDYNEKVVLYHVRHSPGITKAEIARRAGLTAQTVSVIVNRLLANGLLKPSITKNNKKQVGYPARPVVLNPDALFSIGISICRRSLSVSLSNFCCQIISQYTSNFDYPDPQKCLDFIETHLKRLLTSMPKVQRANLIGIGISAPYGLGDRSEQLHGPSRLLENWTKINLKTFVETLTELPIYIEHDVKAACLADMTLAPKSERTPSYLYIFLGTILGGALVLDDTLYKGRFGYAGALGPMITGVSGGQLVRPVLEFASVFLLDDALKKTGAKLDKQQKAQKYEDFKAILSVEGFKTLDNWVSEASAHLALLVNNACSVIDFEAVVIDGDLPSLVVKEVCARTEKHLQKFDFIGLIRPTLKSGELGHESYALGASILPFYSNFEPTKSQFLNQNSFPL